MTRKNENVYFDVKKNKDIRRKFNDIEKRRISDITSIIKEVLVKNPPGDFNYKIDIFPSITSHACRDCGDSLPAYTFRLIESNEKCATLFMHQVDAMQKLLNNLNACLLFISTDEFRGLYLTIIETSHNCKSINSVDTPNAESKDRFPNS